MAAVADFKVSFDDFVRRIVNRAGPNLVKAAGLAMLDVGRAFERKIRLTRLRGGTTDDRLGVRTGALARSFGVASENIGTPTATVTVGFGPPSSPWSGPAEKYAPVHEGLVPMPIRPKVGRYLAVPVADNLTPTGVARIKSPRDLIGADFVPHIFKSGLGYLVFEGPKLMFLLLRYVRIRPRLHFQADWRAFQPQAGKRIEAAIAAAARKADQGGGP